MEMTYEEICREYRQAKKKSVQIGILADENCCNRDEIIRILQQCGELTARQAGQMHRAVADGKAIPKQADKIEPEDAQKADAVNHPAHYTAGGIECIDAIAAATEGLTGIEAVCTANAIKYLWRWKRKNGAEDLRKAEWYISHLLTELGDAEG